MFKKKMALVLAIMIAISVLTPSAYAMEASIYNHPFEAKYSESSIFEEDSNYSTGIETSTNLLSMTEVRKVEVSVNLGYSPDLNNLEWTFGGLPFEEWKSFQSGEYIGPSFITFDKKPYLDDDELTVKAVIKFDLPYGTTNLQGRPYPRTKYPELLGEYDLTVSDISTEKTVKTPMKLNAYDSYHTWDEIGEAIESIFDGVEDDRYLTTEILGQSEEGKDISLIILAKDKDSVDQYLNETLPEMLNAPEALQEKIANGTMGDYKVPIWINNIHPDEAPGIDVQIDLLKMLTTEDEITYNMTDENGDMYKVTLNVQEALENVILLFNPTQNPDGRYYNTRSNALGFDLNRDNGYQTQKETQAVVAGIAKWTPISFLDLHGFVSGFLIEPCTPPHDPNYEYDLLMKGSLEQAHIMGNAGVANSKYESYLIPLEDYKDGWDDATPAYTATYALHHGAMAHTIEMPEINQDSNDAVVHAVLASISFVTEQKDRLFNNQLEYFRRGIEGEDNRAADQWFVNANREVIGRPRGENENFFPEYYVLPVYSELQKNTLEAYNMAKYLIRNGIKVEKTTTNITLDGVTYPEGSFVVPMHQAKRGFANTVLYDGSDYSDWGAMYAEVVLNFHDQRGFDRYEIRTEGAFDGKTEAVTNVIIPPTVVSDNADNYVLKNINNDTIKAVNQLLSSGKEVSMVLETKSGYSNGDFVVSKKDLDSVKDKYFLEVIPYTDKAELATIQQPKVSSFGYQATYVLNELGFELVGLNDANVIVDDSGNANKDEVKSAIQSGTDYIGINGTTLNSMQASGLLPGFTITQTGKRHEGLLKTILDTNNIITGSYDKEEFLYSSSGTWIESVSETSTVLATISEDDHFKVGWWPGNEAAQGKSFIMADKIGDANITLFAGDITNRAHPQHEFRMLANAIYSNTLFEENQNKDKVIVNLSDIKDTWAEKNIKSLANLGVITGYGDGSFKPNNNITRAEFATMLVKAFNLDITNGKVFSDTNSHWAKNYIATAAANGIVTGYDSNNFGPNDLLTREQMVTMIVNASKLESQKSANNFIDSGDISSWASKAIETAVKNDIITGYTDNSFKPQNNATRAESVTVIVKALNFVLK